jgi:hypothetical protein
MANNIYDDAVEQLPAAPPIAPPAASAPPNPYAAVVDTLEAGQQQALRTATMQAADTTPDRAAQVQRLSAKTGVAADIVERNFDAIQKRAILTDTPYAQMLRESPTVSTWASEPTNAAVAKDDMESLGALEWLVKAPQRALAQGIDSTRYALLRAESITRDLTQQERDQLDAYKFGMQNGGELGAGSSWFRGAITGLMKNIPMLFGAGIAANKYGMAGAAEVGAAGALAGSILPGAGTAAGFTAGAGTGYAAGALYGGFKFGAQLAAGQAYDEFSSFKDELGRPLDPTVAKAAALATGLVNGALMTGGFKVLAETVPGLDKLGGLLTTSAVKQALLQPTVRAGLLEAAKTFAGTLTFETTNMVAQRAAQILIGDVAKEQSGQPFTIREAGDTAADLAHTALGALQDFSLLTAIGPAAGFALDRVRAREAQHNATFFGATGEAVAQSKTFQRLPEAAQAFIAQATKDGPVEKVYAPIDTWATYWQGKGEDPAAKATELTGDPQAFERATRTGEDLAIPFADYATKLAATEHNAFFASELRLAPEQMNAREAQAFEQTIAAQQQAEADRVKAEAVHEAAAPVRESVIGHLVAAGVEQATAESYATLYEHAFTTLGERAGIDPVELFNRYGLTVERPELKPEAQAGETALDQAPSPEFVAVGEEAAENADRAAEQQALYAGEERRGTEGTSPTGVERRNAPIAGTVAERAAQMRAENPNIDADAKAMRQRAAEAGRIAEPTELHQLERGFIRISPDRKLTIGLLKGADLSTFLHESGHGFLEVMRDLATEPGADNIRGDLAILEEHLFAGAGSETEKHERFARGFEAYLMEGKAPSAELRPVFARFRTWLVGVYRSLKGLNIDLTPEVRSVFDRLVASDAAIEQAKAEGHVAPLFTDAAMAGMTPEAFDAYRATVQAASAQAKDDLQRMILRDLTREQQAWWKSERETTRAAVAAEAEQEPIFRAVAAIVKGTHPDGTSLIEGKEPEPLKLAKADLVDRYTADELTALRRRQLYAAEGGVHPDVVAELFGFSSGDELVKALITAPSLKATIETATDARMRQKHGDLLVDGRLPEKAQEAVFGESRQQVIHAELKALTAGMVKGAIPPTSVINAAAERRIADTRIRDVRPGQFLMAARRASQRAFDLLSTHQDRVGAVQAKQQELINLALYREATKAQDAVEIAVRYLRSFDTMAKRERLGKAGGDYLQQIDGLRERFDLTTRTLKDIDRRTSLKDFIDAQKAKGLELAIAPELQNEVRRQHYRDGTVDELRGVSDAVQSIEHVARLKDRLLRNQAKRELEALAADGAAAIDANSNGPRKVELEPRLPGSKGKRDIRGWMIAHRPIQALFRQMDGFKDGFMFDNLWRPAHEARNAEGAMGRAAAAELKRIHTERFRGEEASLYEQTYISAIDKSLSTAARLKVALDYGNDGNRERLRGGGIGNTGPLSDAQQRAIIDTLTERDWTFVKDTATLINSYRDQIGTLHKRVTGVEPTWVEPTPFHTKFGEMPGWYFPIDYEGRASAQALPGPEASFADILTKSSYMRFQTANGHTEARVAHTGIPLRADLGVIGEHLQQVIHDLTHREMLVDAGRILGRREIQDAIYRNYGDQYYNEIKGAFRDLAVGTMPAPEWYRVIAPIRRRASMARLAWNFATMVRHVTNITSGMVRVGSGDVIKAIPQWLGSAKDAEFSSGWVAGNSDLMAHRWNHRMEELASINNEIGLNRGKWASTMRDTAVSVGVNPDLTHRMADSYLYGIHKIIQMAEIPTWIAAYHKAVDGGMEHPRAVASADNAILDAFGGGDLLDQAGVQRSYGGKLFSTFMTYGLSLHRQNYEIFSKDQSVGRKMIDATMLNVVPVMLLGAIFNQVHNKHSYAKELAEDAFAEATGMFVFVRELSNALRTPDYSGPSSLSALGTAARLIFNVKSAVLDEESGQTTKAQRAAKTSVELAGQFYGVPVYQVEKTAAGIQALSEGKTKNPAAVLFGVPKEK